MRRVARIPSFRPATGFSTAMTGIAGCISNLARRQHGILTKADLLRCGATPKAIRTRLAAGELVPVHKGVYRLSAIPFGFEGRVLAAQRLLEPHGVVSHRAAARLHDLGRFNEAGIVELTVPRPRPAPRGTLLHRSSSLDVSDTRNMRGFVVTRIERTLMDLGSVVSADEVEIALESALFQGQTTLARLDDYLRLRGGRGRRGSRILRQLVHSRDPGTSPTESVLETRFFRLLMDSPLPKPVPQFVVEDAAGFVARIDLAYPADLVGLEAHSLRWHSARLKVAQDAARHNRLTGLGWRMLYVTYEELNERPEQVLDQLAALLGARLF